MNIKKGLIKRLHVDKHVIAAKGDKPITIQTSVVPIKCKEARILEPSTFVYSPDKPLSCGAKLWVETTAEVVYE